VWQSELLARISQCAVKGAGQQRVQFPSGSWFVPPGSNWSSGGGNEAAEASDVEGRVRRLGKHAGRNVSERRAGLEKGNAGADPAEIRGRPKTTERYERTGFVGPAGVVATACMQRGPDATREASAVIRSRGQPATRESQAGPFEVSGRPIVPEKPGNAGGGKGP
jgi:hypothetical protein